MNKLLKNQLENTQTLEFIQMNITRKFRNAVVELIDIMQDGVGYVAFNDKSGLPSYDDTTDIFAVRVVEVDEMKHIEVLLGRDFDGGYENGWLKIYNSILDMNVLFDCLTTIAKSYE